MKEKLLNIMMLLFTLTIIACNGNVKGQELPRVDSIEHDSLVQIDSVKYIPLSQFTWAGHTRYTIDGSLPLRQTSFRPVPSVVVGTLYLGSLIAIHCYQQKAWWSNNRTSFHFEEDWSYALQADKIGHLFSDYLTSRYISEGLIVSGVNWEDANIYGAALGLVYQTYVEIEDGFAKNWGFSPSDWYFDAFGSIFFLMQHYVPAMQNITPKWQYVPCEWLNKPIIDRPHTFTDDYNSSTFWFSLKMKNIIPNEWQKYWLPWLNIAVGYGADGIGAENNSAGSQDQLLKRRFVVGLDYDLIELLPDGGSFWNWMKQTLNFLKLPAPAVEFTEGRTKFFLMYPFQINVGGIHF